MLFVLTKYFSVNYLWGSFTRCFIEPFKADLNSCIFYFANYLYCIQCCSLFLLQPVLIFSIRCIFQKIAWIFLSDWLCELRGITLECFWISDLPVCSPLLHAVLKTLEQWQEMLKSKLDMFNGPPDNYIPDMYLEGYGNQPFAKYRALLEPHNTPFV